MRNRKASFRLASWDYSWPGWYFVTIVVQDRRCCFGKVIGDRIIYTPLGRAADECWNAIPEHHPGVRLDEYVIMPNHLHGIIVLTDNGSSPPFLREGARSSTRLHAGNRSTSDVGCSWSDAGQPSRRAVQLDDPTRNAQTVIDRAGISAESPVAMQGESARRDTTTTLWGEKTIATN